MSEYPQLSRLLATIRAENPASWKSVETAGFRLLETRMYQDYCDKEPQEFRFYSCER